MSVTTQFVFFNPDLSRIGVIPIIGASYSRRLNRVGSCTVLLDSKLYDVSKFSREGIGLIIQVSDELNPLAKPDLDAFWLLDKFTFFGDNNGVYELGFVCANDILKRHRVAYLADEPRGKSPQARVEEPGNVALKRLFDENIGELALTRNLTPYITSAAVSTPSPIIYKTVQFKNLLTAMDEICKASSEAGTNLYFDIIARESSALGVQLEFRTYLGARGRDYTNAQSGNTRIRTSDANFGLSKFMIEYDQPNVAYVAGSGRGSNRPLIIVSNENENNGIFSRRESYVSVQSTDTNLLNNEGLEEIETHGQYLLEGSLIGNLGQLFGYGDRLNIEHENITIACEISYVKVDIAGDVYSKTLRLESA